MCYLAVTLYFLYLINGNTLLCNVHANVFVQIRIILDHIARMSHHYCAVYDESYLHQYKCTLCFKNGTLFILTITKSNVDRF